MFIFIFIFFFIFIFIASYLLQYEFGSVSLSPSGVVSTLLCFFAYKQIL